MKAKKTSHCHVTQGRIVHYVLPNGKHRVAMVSFVHPEDESCDEVHKGCCNLIVFKGESGDEGDVTTFVENVCHDEAGTPRTWHGDLMEN